MKAEILKIAGVKNEKEFYEKFPTKEAFMKMHGKEFKKAKLGKTIQDKGQDKKLKQLTDFGNPPVAQTGTSQTMCDPGFKWDDVSQTCVLDMDYNYQGSPATPSAPINENFEYQEVPKFRVNPLLSSQSSKTGLGTGVNPQISTSPKSSGDSAIDKLGGAAGIAQTAGSIIGGIGAIGAEKRRLKELRQQKKVTDVMAQAAGTRDINPIKRKYFRPEDAMFNPEQLYPSYGTNTNILSAKKGGKVKGNPTEIQNKYVSPTDVYSDLEYVPQAAFGWNDFAKSGGVDMAGQLGAYATGGPSGESQIGGALGKAAGSAIGGPVGGMIGNFFGSTIGGLFGAGRRREMKRLSNQTNANIASISGQDIPQQFNSYMKDGGQVSDYEWVSHTWQPQVIAKFGEHSMKNLLKPDPTMDTLRTGGNIGQNEMFPQNQFALGGELQTTWGGYAEPISHNPYLPGSGETVMFKGNSHEESDRKGRTGIGVKYGNDGEYFPYMEYGKDGVENVTDVEVEEKEPATELLDPVTGEKNMVVFGNLKIPKIFAEQIGDKDAKGKKFKHYVAELAKKENKQNKILQKATNLVNLTDDGTPFGKIAMSSAQASILGANQKLKQLADFKNKASMAQSAINDTAEEFGIDADALAKGKIKIDKEAMKEQAKWGKSIEKAQGGLSQPGKKQGERIVVQGDTYVWDAYNKKWIDDQEWLDLYRNNRSTSSSSQQPSPTTVPTTVDEAKYNEIRNLYQKAKAAGKKSKVAKEFQEKFHQYFPEFAKQVIVNQGVVTEKGKKSGYKTIADLVKAGDQAILSSNVDEYFGPRTEQYMAALEKNVAKPSTIKSTIPTVQTQIKPLTNIPKEVTKQGFPPVQAKKRNALVDVFNQVLPYLRPSDAEPLDPRQLYGEMFAMSDQVEPVQAQLYRPQLKSIYDISLQDQLNEVTAQARAAERMAANNPAAAANIMSMANRERSKILGEQTRMNQSLQAGIIGDNINTLNDAQLKNLAILDQQYGRQEQAKSMTKATKLAALQSTGQKYLQNQLANRTLQTYENMYNYRYDPAFRAINMNPLYQATISQVGDTAGTSAGLPDVPGYEWDNTPTLKKKKKEESARNGSIVKALKRI